MNLFSYDSAFSRFLYFVADVVTLHILWILYSLPLITIGASTTALYYSCMKRIRTGEGYVSQNFRKAFRQNFRQSTILWLGLAAVSLLFFLDIRISMALQNTMGRIMLISCSVFLIPFILVYVVFQLIPLFNTIYNSFFENYLSGLTQIGPNFVGLENYKTLFTQGDIWIYAKNTMILWIMCFVPQIILSLLLGAWFSDVRLKLKGSRFFKTVIYLPNLIMASAFSMLFFTLFSDGGPINSILMQIGIISEPYKFLANTGSARGLIALMNCLMWFGNTTILLMAGMMGIDTSLFEAAEVDGATSTQVFYKITLPLLRPILVYVVITSLIGGLQLFDVPQILTNGTGDPMRSTMTLIMFLNKHLYSKNYGMAGAVSVILFIITAILSLIVFKVTGNDKRKA